MVGKLEETYFGSWWQYFTWFNILLVTNALLGLLIFEWTWYRTRRLRKPITELNAQFPELCRNDAPYWSKWKHYPGAVTLFLPRFFIILLLSIILAILINVWLIGHDRSQPLSLIRRFLCRCTTKTIAFIIGLCGFFTYFSY